MQKELTLVEAIESEIVFEQNQYEHALKTGKPVSELKRIQEKIEYLKEILYNIQHRYAVENKESN
jgi:hypothetical protein